MLTSLFLRIFPKHTLEFEFTCAVVLFISHAHLRIFFVFSIAFQKQWKGGLGRGENDVRGRLVVSCMHTCCWAQTPLSHHWYSWTLKLASIAVIDTLGNDVSVPIHTTFVKWILHSTSLFVAPHPESVHHVVIWLLDAHVYVQLQEVCKWNFPLSGKEADSSSHKEYITTDHRSTKKHERQLWIIIFQIN